MTTPEFTKVVTPSSPRTFVHPGLCKLTVLVYDCVRHRVCPLFTIFVSGTLRPGGPTGSLSKITHGRFSVVSTSLLLDDLTSATERLLAQDHSNLCAKFVDEIDKRQIKISRARMRYVHRYMVECELPKSFHVPCCAIGWPQMRSLDKLSKKEALAAFGVSLKVAKVMVGFREEEALKACQGGPLHQDIAEKLFVCALRVYSGVYPDGNEDIDDRSLGCLKLYTNSDCDDMCITLCAFFNRLKTISEGEPFVTAPNFDMTTILGCCLPLMTQIVACQGIVSAAVANPRAAVAGKGHVWCTIIKKNAPWLHVESTRCVNCHRASDTQGQIFFGEYVSGVEDEVGLSVFDVVRYKDVCAVYTDVGMWVPVKKGTNVGGVCYADLLSGVAGLPTPVLPSAQLSPGTDMAVNTLRHKPTHAQLAFVRSETPDGFFPSPQSAPPMTLEEMSRKGIRCIFGSSRRGQLVSTMVMPCCIWSGWQ